MTAAAAYLILIPVFILAGGKAYYMAGLYPILLAGGALSVERWLRTNPGRAVLVSTAVALTAVASTLIGLDVLPVRDLRGSVVIALNPDAGETVGWPRLTETVAAVYRSLPATTRSRTAIFTHTYGEAGAIAHFGPSLGLPYPYSGHNAWALWGPPPNTDTTALLVGIDRQQAEQEFTGCQPRARITTAKGSTTRTRVPPCSSARVTAAPGRASGVRCFTTTELERGASRRRDVGRMSRTMTGPLDTPSPCAPRLSHPTERSTSVPSRA